MKLDDRQIADTVNELRDIAEQYHGMGQLRERIARVIVPLLKPPVAAVQDDVEIVTERIRQSAGSFTSKGKIELHKEVEHLLGHIALLKGEQARAAQSAPAAGAVPDGWRDITNDEARLIYGEWRHCEESALGLFNRFKQATHALAEYHAEISAGGEPVYPQWAADIQDTTKGTK